MQMIAPFIAISQKMQTVKYRVTMSSPFVKSKLTINKIRAVESEKQLEIGEALAANQPLRFVELLGCTSNAYLLKDTNDKLYLIPFKQLSREEAPRYFSEPFQLTISDQGNNPQFMSNTSLQVLASERPELHSTNYWAFKDWEPAREYIIDSSTQVHIVRSHAVKSIVLKCIAVVGGVVCFEVRNVQYFSLENESNFCLGMIGKGDMLTNLQLSEVLHDDTTITTSVKSESYSSAKTKRLVYDSIYKRWFVNAEYVRKAYPNFKDLHLLDCPLSNVTASELYQSGTLVNEGSYELKAQLGMENFLLKLNFCRNYALAELTARINLSNLVVNEAIAIIQKIVSNGAKITTTRHNLGEDDAGFADSLHEELQGLLEAVDKLSLQQKKELDTTLFSDFAKEHEFLAVYDVSATHSHKSGLLQFFKKAFKDFTFEAIQVGDFILV